MFMSDSPWLDVGREDREVALRNDFAFGKLRYICNGADGLAAVAFYAPAIPPIVMMPARMDLQGAPHPS